MNKQEAYQELLNMTSGKEFEDSMNNASGIFASEKFKEQMRKQRELLEKKVAEIKAAQEANKEVSPTDAFLIRLVEATAKAKAARQNTENK